MYERRLEGSLYRTMAELHKVQGRRRGAGGAPGTSPRGAVRDTHPTDLSMEQDRGGPFHRVRETLPPNFTLENLLAKIAALEETPAGATSNAPQAQSQSCETKPICGSPRGTGIPSAALSGQALPVNQDHGQDADATIPPAAVTTNVPQAQGQSCETQRAPSEAGAIPQVSILPAQRIADRPE